MKLLELIPMKGIEGSLLDSEQIMKVMLRAAVDTTSVNSVTTNTKNTPNREPVMDWLHTLKRETMLDAVNGILALVAMTVLDPPQSRTICLDFIDNPFHGYPDEDEVRRMEAHGTEPRGVIGTVLRSSSRGESHSHWRLNLLTARRTRSTRASASDSTNFWVN
jgi:hypothetical protein